MIKTKSYQPKNVRKAIIVLFVVSALLYVNTLPNKYAIDDKMMIYKNTYTMKGVKGINDILTKDAMAGMFGEKDASVAGGRYRPLSMISFAIEQEIFKGNPHVSHFFNLLFYALSVVILYRLLLRFFPDKSEKYWYLGIAFVASLLFAVHPLHTDAVANIKGRDEIFCFLFVLLSWQSVFKFIDTNKIKHLIISFAWFLLSVFSKETAITFLFLIPLSIYFFADVKPKTYLKIMLPILAASFIYLFARYLVVGNSLNVQITELMNNPFLEASTGERYATVFMSLGIYLKLLFFPHPLTWDYYPYHLQIISWSDWRAILPLIIYLALGVYAVWGIKKKSIYAFGIWIFFATLSITSNLFFNVGAFMSERFVYISLLGFCIALAYFFNTKLMKTAKMKQLSFILILLISTAFSAKTIARNFNWKDNLTLFAHDVKISSNSAKGNSSYASELYSLAEDQTDTVERNKLFNQAIPYFEKALEIYPAYTESLVRLGNCHYIMYGDYKTMMDYYLKTFAVDPNNADAWGNAIGVLVNNVHDPVFEFQFWQKVIKLNQSRWEPYLFIGDYYREQNNVDSAVFYLEKAYNLNTSQFDVLKSLGISYGMQNKIEDAKNILLKAATINDQDAELMRYIGLSYGFEGNDLKALEYFEKAYMLNPNDQQVIDNLMVARARLGLN
ncbi:MAG: hypothetical protein GX879_05350 [Bacteroidales bacterium]|nr:hypothetical protein [Bacteroidales bacterium]